MKYTLAILAAFTSPTFAQESSRLGGLISMLSKEDRVITSQYRCTPKLSTGSNKAQRICTDAELSTIKFQLTNNIISSIATTVPRFYASFEEVTAELSAICTRSSDANFICREGHQVTLMNDGDGVSIEMCHALVC